MQEYRYSETTGELTGITAPSGDTIHFTYDHQGRLTSTLYPGAVEDLLYYDGDSRLRARKTGTSFGTDHFSRDAAGRIVSVAVGQGAMGSYTARSWYGPLGAVVAAAEPRGAVAVWAMDARLREAGLRSRLLLQVHDELVFELPEGDVAAASPVIERVMAEAALPAVKLDVPLGIEIGTGKNWDEAH